MVRPSFGGVAIGACLVGALAIAHAEPDHGDEVIEISGRAPPEPERQTITTDELHVQPGGGNDALRAVSSLPGVARIPFGLGGLSLRGASPHDTRVLLDGIEVPILYHFGGLASFVPIDVLDHVELAPSGFSARWGRGIGGVVLLDSRTPHVTEWRARGEVSLLHAGALAEGPGPLGGSWLVGVRRSYIDAVLAAAQVDLSIAPSYLDSQLRWESGDGRWTALLFGSDDGFRLLHDPNSSTGSGGGIHTTNVKSFDYASRFARLGLRYRRRAGATTLTVTPWLGIDDITAIANHKGVDKGYTRTDVAGGTRAELATPLAGGTLRTGVDVRATHYDYAITNTPPPSPSNPGGGGAIKRSGQRWAQDAGVFVEHELPLAGGTVAIRPGLRFDYFALADSYVVDPRLAVLERLGDGVVVSETLGLYHEPPLVTDLDPIFGERTLGAPSSIQLAVALEAPVGGLFDGKATVYAQQQRDLPVDVVTGATPISDNGGAQSGGLLGISRELVDEQFGSYSYREYIGKGYSWGVELVAKRDFGALTGFVSYTYARAFRTGDPGHDPGYYPYVLDQPQLVTIVATRPLSASWRIGGRFRFATGNPITPVAGAYYSSSKMQWTAIDGALLSQRLPDFVQLDLRVDHVWRRRWGILDLYLDIQNVTNRTNPEGVDYNMDFSQRRYTSGLPIFPALGLEYRPLP